MCGIAGLLDPSRGTSAAELEAVALAMADTLHRRGPDDRGAWADAEAGVALASRRLAIVDLSPLGHQPMASACGRFTVAYNGEVYNHRDLRSELERAGYDFRGQSDTEVLLAAVCVWGLDGALARCNGMFAFALWDRDARALHLVRDRLGEKPLYYGRAGRRLVFGSELKALRAHPEFAPDVDRDALAAYLRLSYVPSPHTIYRGVHKLPAGTVLTVGPELGSTLPPPRPYWSLATAVTEARSHPFTGAAEDACEELDRLLRDAVASRMQADVPLGAFLSGGVDSSTVVALMQAQSDRPVRTFTIAMPAAGFDESREALAVARHLGTDHTSVELTPDDALALVPRLPELYDEPFADPSQLPTLLVSQVARRDVTVALSGDGGDEVFAGYNRHLVGRRLWQPLERVPGPVRAAFGRALLRVPPSWWDRAADRSPGRATIRNAGDKMQKLGALLGAATSSERYRAFTSQWPDPAELVVGGSEPHTLLNDAARWPPGLDATELMVFLDTAVSLPDDMLTKVDRASMGASLEARVPLLDHRVVELAWRLPLEMRIRGREGKWVLRRVLDGYVPDRLVSRPKMGFDPPLGEWLRGPLREWAEGLLDERRLRGEGFIEPGPVRAAWHEHLSGRRNWDYRLWAILMFEAWLG
jgi:asparagine synthase (glutamine-hydrolysing)